MSIYLRYSSVPVTLSRPFETASSRDINGNLKVLNFPNQWGTQTTSFAVSGFMSLAASSGIYLNSPNFVNASGIMAHTILSQEYGKIDSSGNIIEMYPGTTGGLVYKQTGNSLSVLSDFIFDSNINKLISVNGDPGSPLYVHPGTGLNGENPTREVTTYSPIVLKPEIIIPQEGGSTITIPANVSISGADFVTENIQIGYYGDSYKNTILTHQGADTPAAWVKAEYLKADGALWNRYPKRAVRIENNRIIFYAQRPAWAIVGDPDDYNVFNIDILLQEYGLGDTIAITEAESLTTYYVKPAISVSFAANDTDPSTAFTDYINPINFTEILSGDNVNTNLTGFVMEVCPGDNLPQEGFIHGYAFSVKKGAYLTMQLEPDATEGFNCGTDPTDLTFKPSTLNTISIRPDTHTTFNSLAENIDFIIYGQTKTPLDSYDATLFGLDSHNVPSGLTAGFKLDANIPNAVAGNAATGVIFSQYLDRNRTIPTGYIIDETPKISINRNTAYPIASITSGVGQLTHYASLSVSGAIYSDEILATDIYLTPAPLPDGTGKYVANALLTVNSSGKIISRKAPTNPTVPSAPTNLEILINGNNECTLKWVAGPDGGRQIVNYIVEFSANNGNTWTTVPSENLIHQNAATTCTVTDLLVSVSYIFRVKAQNSVGISSASSSVSYTANYDLSQAPQSLVSSRSFGDALSIIDLSWQAPESEGSSAISGYIIEESENNGLTWIYHNTTNSLITGLSETIYGLPNANNYLYRISAINTYGQGTYNFVYVSGNVANISVEEQEQQQAQEDVLSNWDFGVVLFTGVCS